MEEKITDQQFLDFYDKNIDKIYRFVFFRVPGKQEAQDLTSEIFTKTWQYISRGNKVENLRALLYQIARNALIDYYRLAERSNIGIDEVNNTEAKKQGLITDQDDISQKIDAELDLKAVKEALNNLKREYQEAVILRYLNDLDLQEVAEIMDKSYGATRVLITRALSSLKRELSKDKKETQKL